MLPRRTDLPLPGRVRTASVLLGALALVVAACGTTSHARTVRPASAPTTARSAPTSVEPGSTTSSTPVTGVPHVMVMVFENREFSQVIGNPSAPYFNELARRYGLATASYGQTHPSLPNYLTLIAGSPLGVSSDCLSCTVHGATLVDQLEAKGIGWRAYMQGAPTPCYRGVSSPGHYAKRHDPFMYFPHLADNPAQCDHVVPFHDLAADLASNSAPPFLWVTPNTCDDAHNCSIATADAFLQRTLPMVLASSWYAAGGVVIVTFDEGTTDASCCRGAAGGRIPTIVVSARTPPGARSALPVDQAGTLATVEDLYGLPHLRLAACRCSGSLLPLLH
jgi:hypothetical protein